MNKKILLSAAVIFVFAVSLLILLTSDSHNHPAVLEEPLKMGDKEKIESLITAHQEQYDNILARLFVLIDTGGYICTPEIYLMEKIDVASRVRVYADVYCDMVVVQDGDIYRTSSRGGGINTITLQKNKDSWDIVEYSSPMKTKWSTVPQKVINSFNPLQLGAKHVAHIGKRLHIDIPLRQFNGCVQDADCKASEQCILEGAFNRGGNKCMKRCLTHTECGKGYVCGGICPNGENGCQYTSVNVCIPSLPNYELQNKNDNSWH